LSISLEDCAVYPIRVPARYNLRTFNFYLLKKAGALFLVDAGVDSETCWEALLGALAANGLALRDLTGILLTHSHPDHTGLINRITALREVPVYAHAESVPRLRRDRAFIAMRISFFEELYRQMGCGPAGERQVRKLQEEARRLQASPVRAELIPLREGDCVAGGLRVVETPGHAPDHLVYWDARGKRLFAGDHLIGHMSSNALVEPDRAGRRMKTLSQYADSLSKCLDLDMELAFPGHGELIHRPHELIQLKLNRIQKRADRILRLVTSGLSTASRLGETYFQDLYHQEFPLVMSEVIGYLDYLEMQHKIRKELKDEIWHYFRYEA
jgi:glyoxylase-like metal-dependent hydrolase (beta-lactamase superfamily II)